MVTLAGARRVRLDEKITVMAADCEFTSMVPRSAPGRKYTAAVGLGSTPGSDLGMSVRLGPLGGYDVAPER